MPSLTPKDRSPTSTERASSIVLCSSVLHHIPDYLGFIEETVLDHLEPGGTLFAFQDPL